MINLIAYFFDLLICSFLFEDIHYDVSDKRLRFCINMSHDNLENGTR